MAMSLSEIEAAMNLLSARVADLEQFDPETIDKRWHPRVTALQAAIDGTLAEVFGNRSPDYIRRAGSASTPSASCMLTSTTCGDGAGAAPACTA
jgi:hypothetical protein